MDWSPVVNPFIGDPDLQDFEYDKPRAAGSDVPTVLRYEVSATEPLQVEIFAADSRAHFSAELLNPYR